jgi:hypothetical protein
MPKPGDYTPARRVAMQGILWGVLLLAFALAALVDRRIGWTAEVLLGLEKSAGHVHFRLPEKWTYRARSRDYPGAVGMAGEPRGQSGPAGQAGMGGFQRILVIYSVPVQPDRSAVDYLNRSGLLQDIFGDAQVESSPATLDGYEGVRVQGQVEISGLGGGGEGGGGTVVESDMILCAVFPDGLAVTVRISKNGELDLSDEELLDKIAKTVRLDDLGDTAGVGQ